MWAAIGAFYALGVALLHHLALRNGFRPNSGSLVVQVLPAILLVGVLGMLFGAGVTFYSFAKAIADQEG